MQLFNEAVKASEASLESERTRVTLGLELRDRPDVGKATFSLANNGSFRITEPDGAQEIATTMRLWTYTARAWAGSSVREVVNHIIQRGDVEVDGDIGSVLKFLTLSYQDIYRSRVRFPEWVSFTQF